MQKDSVRDVEWAIHNSMLFFLTFLHLLSDLHTYSTPKLYVPNIIASFLFYWEIYYSIKKSRISFSLE